MAASLLARIECYWRWSEEVLLGPNGMWRRQGLLWLLTGVLLIQAGLQLKRGFRTLLVEQDPPPIDLHFRWLEQRYFYNRQNPYDVAAYAASLRKHEPLPNIARDYRFDPVIGELYYRQGGYPPWYFPTAVLFVLPTSFQTTRFYFAGLNVVALLVTFLWAYQVGRVHSRAGGAMLGAATLALYANYKAVEVGQFGIVVGVLLIATYYLGQSRRLGAAGITYAMALLKPQISALYVLVFLVRRQWKLLATATAYGLVASLATWGVTRTNPVEMLGQMRDLTREWVNPVVNEQSPVAEPQPAQIPEGIASVSSVLLELDVSWEVATPLGAALGLVCAVVVLWYWRTASLLAQFATAATIGRLWCYHHNYDDVMLVFLLVAMGKAALTLRSRGTILAFGLVLVSLCTSWPYRFFQVNHRPMLMMQLALMATWTLGLVVLLAGERTSSPTETGLPGKQGHGQMAQEFEVADSPANA
jgi:hypothetical protein